MRASHIMHGYHMETRSIPSYAGHGTFRKQDILYTMAMISEQQAKHCVGIQTSIAKVVTGCYLLCYQLQHS